jgi:hypothetical protein
MVEEVPMARREGDTTILPVVEERFVVMKQFWLKEEVRIRRRCFKILGMGDNHRRDRRARDMLTHAVGGEESDFAGRSRERFQSPGLLGGRGREDIAGTRQSRPYDPPKSSPGPADRPRRLVTKLRRLRL